MEKKKSAIPRKPWVVSYLTEDNESGIQGRFVTKEEAEQARTRCENWYRKAGRRVEVEISEELEKEPEQELVEAS